MRQSSQPIASFDSVIFISAGNPHLMHIRAIELVRAAWGLSLLVSPATVLKRFHGVRVDDESIVIARILGARHLTQASLSGLNPSPEILAGGVWVDGVHSLTAAALAVVDRDRVRAGVTDAAIAALWAAFGWHDLRSGNVPPRAHARLRDRLARNVFGTLPGGRALMSRAERAREG